MLVSSPQLLSDSETCARKGYLSARFAPAKRSALWMTYESIRAGLTANGKETPFGEVSGDTMMQLCADIGLDTENHNVYAEGMHHACLADIIVSAIRKKDDPAWAIPPNVQGWTSGCYMSPKGDILRRIVLVSHWSDERHYSECRNWYTQGEIAAYKLPMQIIVAVLGPARNGRRHGPWTMGYRHPLNKQLRFRRRRAGSRSEGNVFNSSWEQVFREDHDEISREIWLQSMLTDDVLRDVLLRVDVPIPQASHLQRIRQMAARKLDLVDMMKQKPEANLSTCDYPIPCVFRNCCHVIPERDPSPKNGFVLLGTGQAPVE